MIVLPYLSWAVTVTLLAVPAVAVVGAVTTNLASLDVMSPALTVISPEVPVGAVAGKT